MYALLCSVYRYIVTYSIVCSWITYGSTTKTMNLFSFFTETETEDRNKQKKIIKTHEHLEFSYILNGVLADYLVGWGWQCLHFVAFAFLVCYCRCTRYPHAHIFLSFFSLFFHCKPEDFQIFQHFVLFSLFLNTRDIVLLLHIKL